MFCYFTLDYENVSYPQFLLTILPSLCTDIILDHDFLSHHSSLEMSFPGTQPGLKICNLVVSDVPPPPLFTNLKPECTPIAVKSRRYSFSEREFIRTEISKLFKGDVIEPSHSPWRAQVLVTTNNNHKRRMVIDYSQTINKYTCLDTYPLPNINATIEKIAQYKIFSCLDLKNAYHQIPISESERLYMGFEADGNLYQFLRIPSGITNGVVGFQRTMDHIIKAENLKDTFAHVNNITIYGSNQEEHDYNLQKFNPAAQKYHLTFNDSKSIISSKSIYLLGYYIENNIIRPDPERLKPLMELPLPTNLTRSTNKS